MASHEETLSLILHAAELRAEGNSWKQTAEGMGVAPDRLRKLVADNYREYERHVRRNRNESRREAVHVAYTGLRVLVQFATARIYLDNPKAGETLSPEADKRQQFYSRMLQTAGSAIMRFEAARSRQRSAKQRSDDNVVKQASKLTQELTPEELSELKAACTLPPSPVPGNNTSDLTKVASGKGVTSAKTVANPAPAPTAKKPKSDPDTEGIDLTIAPLG